jgi:hypothetical protein
VKSLYEQKANKCKHYNGTVNDACEAGIKYESVRLQGVPGKGWNLPCLKDHSEGCSCDKLEFYTDAEIKAQIEESHRSFENTMKARQAIVAKLAPYKKGQSQSVGGEIPCPVCAKGTLRYSRAGYNGHIHARCSTVGCVAWME